MNKPLAATFLVTLLVLVMSGSAKGQLESSSAPLAELSRATPLLDAGLGRGVNFGNMLEAPSEGDWGLTVQEIFFDRVVDAKMQHIRLPISWTHHASTVAPYTIDQEFFQRIDWVVGQALAHDLKIIVNNHHYDALNNDPVAERERALAIWQQIAARYQNQPNDKVIFEILNEPHGQFTTQPQLWNQFVVDALAIIRNTNPSRKVMVGPVAYNSIDNLNSLQLPQDENLICTVHYYVPFEFTHQGAEWIKPVPPVGVDWEPNRFSLAGGFQNWSWNTTVNSTNNGLEITYNAAYAGFQIHNPAGFENGERVTFAVNQPMNLTVSVSNHSTKQSQTYSVTSGAGAQTYEVDISQFGKSNLITNIFIQNQSNSPQPIFTLSEFSIDTSEARKQLIATANDRIRSDMGRAFHWSAENRVPMYLGEFGAYRFGDIDSRVAWTAAVRQNAENFKMNWGYWELGAGFGFYDPNNDSFRLPLLQALVPNFE